MQYLMQHRRGEPLESPAEKIDQAMRWLVLDRECVACRERDFADRCTGWREARNC